MFNEYAFIYSELCNKTDEIGKPENGGVYKEINRFWSRLDLGPVQTKLVSCIVKVYVSRVRARLVELGITACNSRLQLLPRVAQLLRLWRSVIRFAQGFSIVLLGTIRV